MTVYPDPRPGPITNESSVSFIVLLFVFAATQVKCERVYSPGRQVPRSVKRPMHSPNRVFFYKEISIVFYRPSSNIS